jgi:3-oxoacyl-[acyl-carrier protein] reductase
MNSPDIVLVSGAGTGIGRAVSRRLVAEGFHVLAVGRRPGPLELLAKELAPHLDPVSADVATVAGAATVAERVRIADRISSAGRRCAGVVAAAGGLSPRRATAQEQDGDPGLNGDRTLNGDRALDDVPGLERVPELGGVRQDWLASFESNVLTAVLLVEALREAIESSGGRVVLLSSVAALRGSGGGPYGAAKAALHAFVYDLARELGSRGGTANVVAPGFVPDTEFWAGRLTNESRRERAAQTLVGREGTPEEVASLIAWLLGPDGGWVTGQVLSPNGGVVLGR